MSILSGPEIQAAIQRGEITIDPYHQKQVNPNSYNLRLAPSLLMYDEAILDARRPNKTKPVAFDEVGDFWSLQPGILYLGHTMEWTATDFYAPMIEGRSSLARLGVSVHITGGFGDVGFAGRWTLEITVEHPIKLPPEIEVCQICWFTVRGERELYKGKYQGDSKTEASKLFDELDYKPPDHETKSQAMNW